MQAKEFLTHSETPLWHKHSGQSIDDYCDIVDHEQSPSPPAGVMATADALFEALYNENDRAHHPVVPQPHMHSYSLNTDKSTSSAAAISGLGHRQSQQQCQHQLPTPSSSVSSAISSPLELQSTNVELQHLNEQQKRRQVAASHSFHSNTTSTVTPYSSDVQSTIASLSSLSSSPTSSSLSSMDHHYPHDQNRKGYSDVAATTTPWPPLGMGIDHIKSGHTLAGPNSKVLDVRATDRAGTLYNNVTSDRPAAIGNESRPNTDRPLPIQYPTHFEQHQQQLLLPQKQCSQHEHGVVEEEEYHKKKAWSEAMSGGQSSSHLRLSRVYQTLHKVLQSVNGVMKERSPFQGSLLPTNQHRRPFTSTSIGTASAGGIFSFRSWTSARPLRHFSKRFYRTAKLPLICLTWYLSSAVTNNIGKQLMNQFRYP
ncbi:hypothetical protein BGZ94_005720, partial [Podila epigama]